MLEKLFLMRWVKWIARSNHLDVFCEKGVLENITKLAGKHFWQSLFFNKVAGLRPATLLKKRLWHRSFPVNLVKFLRTPIEHLWWLLLDCFFEKVSHVKQLNSLTFNMEMLLTTRFFYKKNLYQKMSLKIPKTLRKC